MLKWYLIRPLPGNIIGTVFFVSFLLLQIATADVEAPTLQYIARRLLPSECQIIINHEVAEPNPYKSPSNAIDCFRKLVGWSSNLRMNRRDTQLVLRNRLLQIGRNDLATWLVGPPSRGRAVTEETIEYDSWDSKKEGNRKLTSSSVPSISRLNTLVYGPPQIKSSAGLSSQPQQQSISSFSELRRLTGIHSADSFKDRQLVLAESESVHPASSAPVVNVTADPAEQHQTRGEFTGTISTAKENNSKDLVPSSTVGGKIPEDKKHKSKFPRILPHFLDEKTAQCLRVPLSTALVVIGTIMILTCCCALLLRNRLVACFERLRRKKPAKPTSKRLSTDEEQGFMGPRTVGKPPKRSGRKGGGPKDVANVGVQNTYGASNASGESEEKPTGCCSCCARKKKKSRRKWKK